MEGVENVAKKLKLTLLNQDVQTSNAIIDVVTSHSPPDVQTSNKSSDSHLSTPEVPFRHKTTLYLTARQYEILEQIYTRRKLEGKRCDRYSLVGEAIEKTYLPELEKKSGELRALRDGEQNSENG